MLGKQKRKKKGELVACRANGGYLMHLRPAGTWASLCGHSPESETKMGRAGWRHAHSIGRKCAKCFELAAKQDLKLPEEARVRYGEQP